MERSENTVRVMNHEFVKLDRFDGTNYTRWKDKMIFLLTALKIIYVLDSNLAPLPEPSPSDTEELKIQRKKRDEDELLCRGHILNTLSDRLFDLFTSISSPKEIWNALEFKYNTEKQGADKFLTLKYFEFHMVDNVGLLDQVHELQILVSKLKDLKIEISEALQVGAIIAKLPPSWNEYRKKLLHSMESFSLDQLLKHLRIEEETRIRDGKFIKFNEYDPKVNYIDTLKLGGGKKRKLGNEAPISNVIDSKRNKICFHCKKKGHFKKECRSWLKFRGERNKINKVNIVEKDLMEDLVAMVSEMHISMITEVHMAGVAQSFDWWLDSGATIHICNNKEQFKEYHVAEQGHEVLLGNNKTVQVLGMRTIC